MPDGVALDEAVALLADGRTATMLVSSAGARAGGAGAGRGGGRRGRFAAGAARDARPAPGSSRPRAAPRKLALARELGAEVAVDYGAPGWAEAVRAAVGGVDVVFDGVGGEVARAAFGLLDRGGRMVSFGLASGTWADVKDDEAAERGVTLVRGARGTPAELRATRRARWPRPRPVG